MRVIGLDVGYAIAGWSILETVTSNSFKLIDYGAITTNKDTEKGERLIYIYDQLSYIIQKYKPNISSVESLFFFKNQKTVIPVGEVRGVILLALAKNNVEVFSYTPLQIKMAVTSYGRADKKQVQNMVKLLCKLDHIPKPDDAADAIAAAICHVNMSRVLNIK